MPWSSELNSTASVGNDESAKTTVKMALELAVPLTCDNCGACCLEQGAPPDYVALSRNPHFFDDPSFAEDAERFRSLNGEALSLLQGYLADRDRGLVAANGACVWYDHSRKQCRFYDLRPSTCRVFQTGEPGCLIYRKRHGVDASETMPMHGDIPPETAP
jgi:Fe-S-cluster containining protein